eukprot:g15585.t1
MLAAVAGFVENLDFAHLAHNYVKLGEGVEKMKEQCRASEDGLLASTARAGRSALSALIPTSADDGEAEFTTTSDFGAIGAAPPVAKIGKKGRVRRASVFELPPQTDQHDDPKRYLSRSEGGQKAGKIPETGKIQEMGIFSRFCRSASSSTGTASTSSQENNAIADDFEWPRLWKKVFQSSVAPSLTAQKNALLDASAGQVNAYCYVQFIVSRKSISRAG